MHCSCGVSHFPTYIAHIPQLLHILITSPWFTWFISYFGLHCLCSASCPLPLPKSLGIPGQRHVKAIRQKVSEVFFSGHWGESKRLQRSVRKTGRCCGSVLTPPPRTGTHRQIHLRTCTHTLTHTWSRCHTHKMACSTQRENMR